MSPERPDTDDGDSHCQVKKNFSPTPGLTPALNHAQLSEAIRKLHRKHNIPYLKHSGMKLAGSEEWTSIKERPRTLLCVVELKEADRYRWRDIDADLRKLLRKHKLGGSRCYVRYYTAQPQVLYGVNPETETARTTRIARESAARMRHAPSPHPSLPELIPQEERSQATLPSSTRWAQYPGGQRTGATAEERRRVLREQDGVTAAEIDANLWAIEQAEQAQHAQAQQLFWNRHERNDSASAAVENTFRHVPVDDFGSNSPSEARTTVFPTWQQDWARRRARAAQPQDPWQPTEEDLRRLERRPNEYPRFIPSISTDRATLRGPLPSLPPAPLTPHHYGFQDAAHIDSDDDGTAYDQDFADASRIARQYLDDSA